MYSPLRQVEAQREVIRKIWETNSSKLNKLFGSKKFDYYRRVLVVAANEDTILNINKAPKNIKDKVLRADALIRKIQEDYDNRDKDEYFESKKGMEEIAKSYLDLSIKENINYYEFYKNKYCNNKKEDLKKSLIEFRKKRASEMNIPAYYVFTNEEMDKIIELMPKSTDELKKYNILTPIKIKTHGELLIQVINRD